MLHILHIFQLYEKNGFDWMAVYVHASPNPKQAQKNHIPVAVWCFFYCFYFGCLLVVFFVLPCDFLFTMTFDLTSHWNGKRRIYFGSFVLILLLSRVKFFIGFIFLSFEIRLSFCSSIPFTCCILCANTIKTNQTNKRLRRKKAKKEFRMKHCVMSVLKSNFHCNIHIFAHFMRQK